MFANYNYSNYPEVHVSFMNLENDDDFTKFTNEWLNLYKKKKKFTFIFDTLNIGYINPKYAIYMGFFIKMLKKQEFQYLENSTIYVYSKFIYNLLKLIFYIEKPVAPVIVYYKSLNNILLEKYIVDP